MSSPLTVLFIGFYRDLVEDVLNAHPGHRVLVVEEEDLLPAVGREWLGHPRVAFRPGAYQLSTWAATTAIEWFRDDPFDAVAAGREYGVRAAQRAAEALGMRGPGRTAAEACTDKLVLRSLCEGQGLTRGRFAGVGGPEDIRAFFGGSPVILKPRSRNASLGVIRIDDPSGAESAWWRATASHKQGNVTEQRELRWEYLVEDLVPAGAEFSVESLVHQGATVFGNITSKTMDSARHFSPLGHVLPAALPDEAAAELMDAQARFLRLARVDDGLVHSEWIRTPDGPHLIEAAVRYPGGSISRLVEGAYGFSLADEWIRSLSGHQPRSDRRPIAVAGVHYLTSPAGQVASVGGLDLLESAAWVAEHRISLPPGGEVSGLRNSMDRLGHVVVVADSHDLLRSRLDQVRERVTVAVRATPGADAAQAPAGVSA